jgi:hypothetical protein
MAKAKGPYVNIDLDTIQNKTETLVRLINILWAKAAG